MKVKCKANFKINKSGGSIKKSKGKTRKGQRVIPPKKQNASINNMKKHYEKLLAQKVETEAAKIVSATEPRSLKYVANTTNKKDSK